MNEPTPCPTCGTPVERVAAANGSDGPEGRWTPILQPLAIPPSLHGLSAQELRRVVLGLRVEIDRLRLLLAAETGALSTGTVRRRLGVDYVSMRDYRDQHLRRLLSDMAMPPERIEQALAGVSGQETQEARP